MHIRVYEYESKQKSIKMNKAINFFLVSFDVIVNLCFQSVAWKVQTEDTVLVGDFWQLVFSFCSCIFHVAKDKPEIPIKNRIWLAGAPNIIR